MGAGHRAPGLRPQPPGPQRAAHRAGSFVYDADGFDRALELLATDGFPTDLLIDPEDVPLNRLSDALTGLAEGRLAGKVMVVPPCPHDAGKGARLMAHPYYPSGVPRFNHVAMSLPADLLDETNRDDICRFWGEVLGFDEMDVMTEDRQRLILSCVHWDQFIFLIAEDEPMALPADGPLRLRGRGPWPNCRGSRTGPWPSGTMTTGST